jgi:hypothetical protein
LVAVRQLGEAADARQTAFEDELDREFRELDLPLGLFYENGHGVAEPSDAERRAVYRYIDLTNHQIFLRSKRRVSLERSREWRDGIADLLERRFGQGSLGRDRRRVTRVVPRTSSVRSFPQQAVQRAACRPLGRNS